MKKYSLFVIANITIIHLISNKVIASSLATNNINIGVDDISFIEKSKKDIEISSNNLYFLSKQIQSNNLLIDEINEEIKSADKYATIFRSIDVGFPVILAAITAFLGFIKEETQDSVANESRFIKVITSRRFRLFLVLISAMLTSFYTGITAIKKADFHTTRKRALEYIRDEAKKSESQFSKDELRSLMRLTKTNPKEVLIKLQPKL